MKIALINENSQASKNGLIFSALENVAVPLGHQCFNYGRFSASDPHERTYVQAGLLAAILLNSRAADFVITGCGTGMGAMLACNSFPGVMCGWAREPLESYLFSQVNAGNALSVPFAMGFGWGGELELEYIFEKLLAHPMGGGYPDEWAGSEAMNRETFMGVKAMSHRSMLEILRNIDSKLLMDTIAGPVFPKLFFENCQDGPISGYIRSILAGTC